MKLVIWFTLSLVLLSACSPAPALPATTPALTVTATLAVPTLTATPSPSATPYPTETPAPPTQTPLPTIPTFTPTFDARTIVKATPAPKAECPKENPKLSIDLKLDETSACISSSAGTEKNPDDCVNRTIQNDILNYLNQGGRVDLIINQLQIAGQRGRGSFIYQDLTDDNVPDFVVRDFNNSFAGYHFYVCENGRYRTQSIFDGERYANQAKIRMIKDINMDGVPEIVTEISGTMVIFAWDGKAFVEVGGIRDFGESSYDFRDINKNGTQEIILTRGYPGFCCEYSEWPWRKYKAIYSWNSSKFIETSRTYDKPVYRFQTIQDADQNVLHHEYGNALASYQDAVFNSQLDWWSANKREYTFEYQWATTPLYINGTLQPTEVIPPAPVPDTTEYPRLAAYAYYRMVILHTHLGEKDAAQLKYATLQEKFPAGDPGHPYVEMATAFWDAYQSSQKMYNACAAAIAYADVHPEILVPLGSDYHGWQSHTYEPADVCPFR